MANWFIGLPLRAGPWFDRLVARAPDDLQRFHREDLHATVAFLGACGDERALAAWGTLEGWARAPVRATLGRLEPFGNPKRPSALSVTLRTGREDVAGIIALLRGPMFVAANVAADPRDPLPHVTILRPGRHATASARRRAVDWAQRLPELGDAVEFDRIALYTWSDDRRERQFRIVKERPFG